MRSLRPANWPFLPSAAAARVLSDCRTQHALVAIARMGITKLKQALILGALLVAASVLAGCGHDSPGPGGIGSALGDTGDSAGPTTSNVSREVAQGWLAKWCAGAIRKGMDEGELRRVMGPPTTTYPWGAPEPEQVSWDAYELSFTAFMGSNGRAYDVQDSVGTARC